MSFGADLPMMRDWVPKHFDFAGYVIGEHPQAFGDRKALRARLGYRNDEQVCIVTVGGSGVGAHLIRRILQAYPDREGKASGATHDRDRWAAHRSGFAECT